jgi:hypothetical protein
MSQEINLLNPALRRKLDWLSFDSVAVGALAALFVVSAVYGYAAMQLSAARAQSTDLSGQLAAAQDELQASRTALAARKNNPAVENEYQELSRTLRLRQEIYRLAAGSTGDGSGDVADVMRGFSRQIVNGVWLTGFALGPGNFEIRGRVLEPSLLPAYIRRLNGEPAFRGRQFAALDMRSPAEPPPAAGAATAGNVPAPGNIPAGKAETPVAAAAPRYLEFVLRASAAPAEPAEKRP